MLWIVIIIVVAAVAGGGAIFWVRSRRESVQNVPRAAPMAAAAPRLVLQVELPADGNCCDAVREIRESRFEEGEAPSLPLGACTMKGGCRCLYRSVPDRRARVRRSQDERRKAIRFDPDKPARRKGHGRRKSERTKWF